MPTDGAALDRARARVMAGIAAPRAPQASRRAVLVGAVALVGGAVAASVVALPRSARADGLSTAAAEVTDPRLLPGQYLRVTTLHDVFADRPPMLRTTQVLWVPWDRRRVWVQRTTAPDGSVHVDRAALGQVPSAIDYEAVELLAASDEAFRSLPPHWADMSRPEWSWVGVQWAQTLLSSGEVPAAPRARLYRYLAGLPGVQERGTTRLANGRAGTVFAADDDLRIARWEVVIDTASGDYLGDRYFSTAPGTPPGGRLLDARAISTAVVDGAP